MGVFISSRCLPHSASEIEARGSPLWLSGALRYTVGKGPAVGEREAEILKKTSESDSTRNRLITVGLAVPALLLIVVTLFATLEIVLTLAAPMIASSAADSTRGRYALVTLRNLWLIFGGMLSLGLIIYSLDRLFKQAAKPSTRRFFLRLLAVELVIIGAQFVVVG